MARVLITGCSSGFGKLTALAFAARGDDVLASMRRPEVAPPELAAAGCTVVRLDVTDDTSTGDALAAAGEIDILVNNAGVGYAGPVETIDESRARAVMETDFWGPVRLIRGVLPSMRARGSGVIVNVTSGAGLMPAPPNSAFYSASKHALEALSEILAIEVEPFGVRVALVEPGFFATDVFEKSTAGAPVDPASPYADYERRSLQYVGAAVAAGDDPQSVADTIVEAATTGTPRLRWMVGAEVEPMLQAYRGMTDAEWRAMVNTTLAGLD